MNATAQAEIDAYVDGVRAALAGLPEDMIGELTDDLPEHLAEVRAEDAGSLTERLGTPEAYADELRAAAGFTGEFPSPSEWEHPRERVLRALRLADVRVGPVLGYAKASEFLVLLRPAWWVLRGYLLAMFLAWALDDDERQSLGLLPRLGGSDLVAIVLIAACVAASIWLGRKQFAEKMWARLALISGSALLVLFGLAGFVQADHRAGEGTVYNSSPAAAYDPNPNANVQDVYVYDANGHYVPGAHLYDQTGQPIQLGDPSCSYVTDTQSEAQSTQTTPVDPTVSGYPLCGSPRWPGATASPTAGQTAVPSSSPSVVPSAGPSGTPSPVSPSK